MHPQLPASLWGFDLRVSACAMVRLTFGLDDPKGCYSQNESMLLRSGPDPVVTAVTGCLSSPVPGCRPRPPAP